MSRSSPAGPRRFQSLIDDGVQREEAVSLVTDVMWRLFKQNGRFGQAYTRLRSELKTWPRRRLPDDSLDLGFPFGPPDYRAVPLPAEEPRSFAVARCPVAAYIRADWRIWAWRCSATATTR